MEHSFFRSRSRLRLSAGLEAILPRACVLCGSSLSANASPGQAWRGIAAQPWPLCRPCAEGLRPWKGERCPSCGVPLISESGRCMRCRDLRRAFDSAYPLFSYEGKMRVILSAYKEYGRRSLSGFFAALLAETIGERWPDRTIVPVPPRPGKLKERGWDQVEEIARILESRGFPVKRPLERRRSVEQKSLGRGERGANAQKAYALKAGELSPELPLLLDDVVTTCATLEACAIALKEGGALSVDAVVIAAD